jgi:hypothetical protein
MAVHTETITGRDLGTRQFQLTPKNHELAFDYHGKERIGVIEKYYAGGVVLALTTDGDETYPKNAPQYKAFAFEKIGVVEVYNLP